MYSPSNVDKPPVTDRSGEVGAPDGLPGMVPTVAVIPGLSIYSIVYCDNSQGRPPVDPPHHLHSLWRDPNGTPHWTDLTKESRNQNYPDMTLGIKNPFSFADTARNTEIVLWNSNFFPVGGDDETGAPRGDVWAHFYSRSESRVDAENLTRTAGVEHKASACDLLQAVGTYYPAEDTHHVIFRQFWNYHIHELWWTGTSRAEGGTNLSKLAPILRGAYSLGSVFLGSQGYKIVLFRTGAEICSLWWKGGDRPGLDQLSVSAEAPRPAFYRFFRPVYNPDPVGYYTAHNDVTQVVYRGENDHLYRLFRTGNAGIEYWDLTERAIAPLAEYSVCNFSAFYSAHTNTHHVIYVTEGDLHLHEISWIDGTERPDHSDLTTRFNAPLARGRPATFATDWDKTNHVVYRGNDNHIYELNW